jgi:hypothetical protein
VDLAQREARDAKRTHGDTSSAMTGADLAGPSTAPPQPPCCRAASSGDSCLKFFVCQVCTLPGPWTLAGPENAPCRPSARGRR